MSFAKVRMGSSSVVHISTPEGFPACGGRYGEVPGTPLDDIASVTCKKCRQMMADLAPAATLPTQATPTEDSDTLSETSDYSVTLTYKGKDVTVTGVKADSESAAIKAAIRMMTVEVEKTTTTVMDMSKLI